ncbi:MAG TPA: glycosyltransferase family 39 protein [Terriglobales bacterium]|nr:glycosyltransferase family 39 protein [Terriglobales bacterium]
MSFTTSLHAVAERTNQQFEKRSLSIAACYSALFFAVAGCFATIKLLWFDEFITLYVVRFQSLSGLWNVLKSGVELNPPLFHLLTRLSSVVFGETPLGLRLPAMIGFWLAGICIFLFVRRRTTPLFAALAVLFTFCTASFGYAYEARPYGVVLGCCGLSLLAWQSLTDSRHRRLALIGLGASLGAAVSCHYYAILLLAPIAAGELVKTVQLRKMDYPAWVFMLAGISPLLLYIPLIRSALGVHQSEHVWNRPQIPFLWESYQSLLGNAWIPLAIIFIWAAFHKFHDRPERPRDPLPYHEVVAVSVLVFLPIIGFAVASDVTNMISERYVLSSIAGCGIAFAFACWKVGNRRSVFALVCACMLLIWFCALQISHMRDVVAARSTWSNPELNAILRSRNIPILVKPYVSLEFEHYGAPEFRSRIVCVIDSKRKHLYSDDDTPERLMTAGRSIFPIKYEEFETFRQQTDSFFIFGGPVGSVEDSVISGGGSVTIAYWKAKYQSPLMLATSTKDRSSSSSMIP